MKFLRVIIISFCILFYSNCVSNAQQDFFKNNCQEIVCDYFINLYNDTVSINFYSDFREPIILNKKNYYPFIFGETYDDTIGYVRFYENKIFIIPKTSKEKKNFNEIVLFDFNPNNKSAWVVKYAGIINNYKIKLERIDPVEKVDSIFIYDFEILPPYPSSITKIKKIYVSKRNGIKSIDLDYDGIPINCSCKSHSKYVNL